MAEVVPWPNLEAKKTKLWRAKLDWLAKEAKDIHRIHDPRICWTACPHIICRQIADEVLNGPWSKRETTTGQLKLF